MERALQEALVSLSCWGVRVWGSGGSVVACGSADSTVSTWGERRGVGTARLIKPSCSHSTQWRQPWSLGERRRRDCGLPVSPTGVSRTPQQRSWGAGGPGKKSSPPEELEDLSCLVSSRVPDRKGSTTGQASALVSHTNPPPLPLVAWSSPGETEPFAHLSPQCSRLEHPPLPHSSACPSLP